MRDIPNKIDDVSSLPADEYNSHKNEARNAVTASGQTLSSGDDNQHTKSHAINAARGNYYGDAGSVNQVELVAIGSMGYPVSNIIGNMVRFFPDYVNTSTEVTIQLGSLTAYFANIGVLENGGTPSVDIGYFDLQRPVCATLSITEDGLTTYWQIHQTTLYELESGETKQLVDSNIRFVDSATGLKGASYNEEGIELADLGTSLHYFKHDGIQQRIKDIGPSGGDTSDIDRDGVMIIDASSWTWTSEGDYYVSTPSYNLGTICSSAITNGGYGAYSISFIGYSSAISRQIGFGSVQDWVSINGSGVAQLDKVYSLFDPSSYSGLRCYIRIHRQG